MRKQLMLAGLLCLTVVAFGQKKEIKKAEKAFDNGNTSEAISYLKEAEGLIAAADNELKTQFYLVKGKTYLADAGTKNYDKLKTAAEAFKMARELNPGGKMAEDLKTGMTNLRVALVNSAVEDQNAQNYKRASEKLYASYQIQKDTSDLYYAAGNAVNAKEYDTALEYYEKLLEMGYTGIQQQWLATDVETGEEVSFASESDRNTYMLSGKYTKPEERMSESVRGDILQKVTLIHISRGENEIALKLMKEARKENPDDQSLLRAEADMAYKMGDMEKYSMLMEEIIAKDPTNPELYYNLGVGSANKGNNEKALEYYKQALSLDPNFTNAKINIAATILSREGAIIEEMNSLGTSKKDYDRYDELKEIKNGLYREAMPYLEAALNDRTDNIELVRTLSNIYSQLGMDDKFKATKARLIELENKN